MQGPEAEVVDYESMVLILRAFARRPAHYGGLDLRSLAAHAGLAEEVVRAVLPAMQERSYIICNHGGYSMPARIRDVAACNPDQLLARDIARWARERLCESFLVRDLPESMRRDWQLLVLAVEDLIKAQALGSRLGGPTSDLTELVIQPRLRTYAFGAGAQSFATQIQQVFGDWLFLVIQRKVLLELQAAKAEEKLKKDIADLAWGYYGDLLGGICGTSSVDWLRACDAYEVAMNKKKMRRPGFGNPPPEPDPDKPPDYDEYEKQRKKAEEEEAEKRKTEPDPKNNPPSPLTSLRQEAITCGAEQDDAASRRKRAQNTFDATKDDFLLLMLKVFGLDK